MSTILLIDDYEPCLVTLAQVLEGAGYAVLATSSAIHGLLLATTGRDIDLVITDFTMPEMSGGELIAELRRFFRFMPVILLSGGHFPNCRADLHLAKGVAIEELLDHVSRLLRGGVSWKVKRPVRRLSQSLLTKPKSSA